MKRLARVCAPVSFDVDEVDHVLCGKKLCPFYEIIRWRGVEIMIRFSHLLGKAHHYFFSTQKNKYENESIRAFEFRVSSLDDRLIRTIVHF